MNNKCVEMNARVNTNNLFAEIVIGWKRVGEWVETSEKKRAAATTLIVIVWHPYKVLLWNFILFYVLRAVKRSKTLHSLRVSPPYSPWCLIVFDIFFVPNMRELAVFMR